MTDEPASRSVFDPRPLGHQVTGCPAVFPWLPECVHYAGPGSLHRLAEQARDIVLATEEKHIRSILKIKRRDMNNELINTPGAERNRLVHLIDGNEREEVSFQSTYEILLKNFDEEKARELADGYKQNTFGTAAICFLEAYNYDTDVLLDSGELVKAYQPVKTASFEQVKGAIEGAIDLWTSSVDSEHWEDDWFAAGNHDIVSLLLHKYFGGEIISLEYGEDKSNWDIEEGEEDYDVFIDSYYILNLNGEDIDLFSHLDRPFWNTEFLGRKSVSVEELEGDPERMSRFSILERRVHGLLTTGTPDPALFVPRN